MQSSGRLFIALSLLVGCGTASAPSEPARDPQAAERLHRAAGENERLHKEFAAVVPEDRSRCEFQAGDCLVLVSESRDKLVSTHNLNTCRDLGDARKESSCIARELKKLGKETELASYLSYENMCIQRILGCTSDLSEQAIARERQKRFEQRRRDIETSNEGLKAWNQAELARERLKYLRATLPPPAVNVCEAIPAVASCEKTTQSARENFEAELNKDTYDQKTALSLFQTMKEQEASCPKPELECITKELQSYGALPESRKWREQNMQLLEHRQTLVSRAQSEHVAECLTDLAEQHQERIVSAYQIYARQPVLFFRNELERAFISLHQAQVYCLSSRTKNTIAAKGK